MDNAAVAGALERVADLLEAQDGSPFRVQAYRTAARTVRTADPVARILARYGVPGLERLPGIGPSIASAIRELVETGRLGMLARLEGQLAPEDLFTTVPGIGEELATRIHRELGVDTLEELEQAAHDGRLERVAGFGPRRVRAVKDVLATMLSRSSRRRARRARDLEISAPEPSVASLLDVDREYRRRAAAGELRTISPRRFNPDRAPWLPVLHAQREGWSITALFSNTARAHELGTTRDWVVLYYEKDGLEDQCTVVTETRGWLAGNRVVRGREGECRVYYESPPLKTG